MIKKTPNISIHEIDLLTNIQSIKIMSKFWVMWNYYFFFLLHIFLHNIHNTCKQQIYCHIFTNMFGMNTSNCNCTPKGAYNVQVLLHIFTSQGFLICTAPQQRPDSCQSETLAERRLYRYFKLLISCYFLHTHTSYRWFFLSKSLMWFHYSYVFFKPMFSICVNSENNVFTTRDALDL